MSTNTHSNTNKTVRLEFRWAGGLYGVVEFGLWSMETQFRSQFKRQLQNKKRDDDLIAKHFAPCIYHLLFTIYTYAFNLTTLYTHLKNEEKKQVLFVCMCTLVFM